MVFIEKKSKSGNSNYKDRIKIIQKFIDIFGIDKIEVLTADREFVGKVWFEWLKKQKVPFVIRIMNNHKITTSNKKQRIDSLFYSLQVNEHAFHEKQITIYGYHRLSIVALKTKDEYLILATNIEQNLALVYYKKRWEIETLFSAFKIRGFNLEETHMSANHKIDSLIAILSIAFVWCHMIGEWINETNPPKTLKHGRKEKSIFLLGFEFMAETLLNYEHRFHEIDLAFDKFILLVSKIDDY